MDDKPNPQTPPPLAPGFRPGLLRDRERLAIVKGQDTGRYTDVYHAILRAPWWLFFIGLAAVFVGVNAIFAMLYVVDHGGIDHARPGNFWDTFVFSVQTIGSINYSVMVPKSNYVNILVIVEAFSGYPGAGAVHRADLRALLAALRARRVLQGRGDHALRRRADADVPRRQPARQPGARRRRSPSRWRAST